MIVPTSAVGIVAGLLTAYGIYRLAKSRYHTVQRQRALDGEYGIQAQWASELVDEGDQMFTIAVVELPNTELKECGIIAESKDELRELVIERFDEASSDELPEEFQ